jgi:CheY-like chemotaxis protein
MGFSRHQGTTSRAFDLRGVVEAITPLLERAVTSAVTLKHERAVQPFMLRGDSAQLEQVIMNLALNARDAMPQGGQVVVRLADLTRDGVPGVALEVEDTGTGIAPEHRAHVFEAFYTTKPESKGTGLGLATVVSIVEAHGGQVDFDTELGRGTVFRVWLPTVVAEQILAATDTVGAFEVTTAVRDGGAVLVVEDDPRILKNATRILRAAGHRVVGVASGTEAQRLAAETRFDVILMDAVMPGLSGPELYAALHAAQPRACVIVTMGFATNDFGRDFFDGGDRMRVQKPYGRADLVEVVGLAVNRARTPVPASVA